jgi:hypothetical protein
MTSLERSASVSPSRIAPNSGAADTGTRLICSRRTAHVPPRPDRGLLGGPVIRSITSLASDQMPSHSNLCPARTRCLPRKRTKASSVAMPRAQLAIAPGTAGLRLICTRIRGIDVRTKQSTSRPGAPARVDGIAYGASKTRRDGSSRKAVRCSTRGRALRRSIPHC